VRGGGEEEGEVRERERVCVGEVRERKWVGEVRERKWVGGV
jgi:hypothetical protein